MSDKFPILDARKHQGCPTHIPWAAIASHEGQAQANHYQSLKRLAERGGLSPCEAVAVLEDRQWHSMPDAEAVARLVALTA